MFKVLLFGENGQVGSEIKNKLQTIVNLKSLSRAKCDFLDLDLVKSYILKEKPDIIINAVAYTAVDKAEKEPELANKINSDSLLTIALAAKETGALVIHFSTDYVFNGIKSTPYTENDEPDPINVYGNSKLQGERNLIRNYNKVIILRTSWVYGLHGVNFVKKILNLAKQEKKIPVVNDQYSSPTSAIFISEVVHKIINNYSKYRNKISFGVFHLASKGNVNWFEYASFVLDEAKNNKLQLLANKNDINPVSSSHFNLTAQRPKNSQLDCGLITEQFGIEIPFWKEDVSTIVKVMIKKEVV